MSFSVDILYSTVTLLFVLRMYSYHFPVYIYIALFDLRLNNNAIQDLQYLIFIYMTYTDIDQGVCLLDPSDTCLNGLVWAG